jgi:hypothetical protein
VAPGGDKVRSDLEILSNTMGVNFAPYLQRVLHEVRRNWYTLIPEVARAPLMKKGKVSSRPGAGTLFRHCMRNEIRWPWRIVSRRCSI